MAKNYKQGNCNKKKYFAAYDKLKLWQENLWKYFENLDIQKYPNLTYAELPHPIFTCGK